MKRITALALIAATGVLIGARASAVTEWSAQDYDLYSGDFNGDGRSDILFVAKDAGKSSGIAVSDDGGLDTVWQSWSSTYLGIQWSGGAHIPVVGDFNGDDKSDVLLQRAAPGNSYLLLGNASGAAFGAPTTVTANVSIASGNARLVAGRFGGAGAGLYVQARTASGVNYIATAVGATTSAVAHDPAAMLGPVETLTYSYDARGRLKTVARIGGVNDSVRSDYTYDKANNRKTVVTTGSSNPPP